MPPLDIDLSAVEEGVNRYRFLVSPGELVLEEEGTAYERDVDVEVRVTCTAATLTVDGAVHTAARRECARCLATFEERVDVSFFEAVRVEGDTVVVLDDSYDGDPGFLGTSPGVMSIDPLVRESILVSSPLKPLCRPDCRGLCPSCGVDRNETECGCVIGGGHGAWSALGGLKKELEKKD